MDGLNIDQLKDIPWNNKYVSGPNVPEEPILDEISE